MYEKFAREGRTSFANMPEVHSSLSEELAIRRITRLAERVSGVPLYILHVSSADGVQAIAESQRRGVPVYGETLTQYALFTAEDYQKPHGQIYHTFPSLRSRGDQQSLWEALASDVISTIATDEILTTFDVKIRGNRIDNVTGGGVGVGSRLGLMYSEGVVRRGFSLERLVDITSANAARILGLFPQKGVIAVGSDADICIIDPSIRRRLSADDLREADYTPFEGWEVTGWPVLTILRGKVVAEGGRLYGVATDGERVPRKIHESVIAGRLE
jgi:dihydropyrimidinase